MEGLLLEFAVLMSVAAILSVIFMALKQPALLAYILTGIIVGPLGVYKIQDPSIIRAMGEFGIALLLFMIGLEIKLSEFKYVGKVTAIAGIGQILLTFVSSYIISAFLGFSAIVSLYLGACLTFSSTIIIVKFISDKRDTGSLYGRMSIGILLIQDLVAILLLMLLAGFDTQLGGSDIVSNFVIVILKGSLLFGALYYLSKSIFPKILDYVAKSDDSLFLVSIAWVLAVSALVASKFIGFSVEIGGFLAGLSLANSKTNYQIIARAKVLRDFFIVLFFILLGTQITFSSFGKIIIPGIILSSFVLFIKPLLIMFLINILGYKKRTAFLTGIDFGQISEFSLILVFVGNRLGHVSTEVTALVAFIAITTFIFSTYAILDAKRLYAVFGKYFPFGKGHDSLEFSSPDTLDNIEGHVIVIGGEQMGGAILDTLEDAGKEVVVVDFDPSIVNKLKDKNVHRVFGDISDLDIQARVNIDKADLVISTIGDLEDNLILTKRLKSVNKNANIITMALDNNDAKILYEAGASYVVLPHLAGGMHIAKIIKERRLEGKKLEDLKEKDEEYIS